MGITNIEGAEGNGCISVADFCLKLCQVGVLCQPSIQAWYFCKCELVLLLWPAMNPALNVNRQAHCTTAVPCGMGNVVAYCTFIIADGFNRKVKCALTETLNLLSKLFFF